LTVRPDKINAKGKGLMTAYWCEPKSEAKSSKSASETSQTVTEPEAEEHSPVERQQLLIDWNVTVFADLLRNIVVHRTADLTEQHLAKVNRLKGLGNPLDEVSEVLTLPQPVQAPNQALETVEISVRVQSQLHNLIVEVASLYRANPFHNFEHASHVSMSVSKILNRFETGRSSRNIAADPLTHFAIVFATLIHDLDHPGVSNAQLVAEQMPVAIKYQGRSVAEQNSVDMAWNLLMKSRYTELRNCICSTTKELQQLRQIVVNVVMATDLFDKQLKAMRESRWEISFGSDRANQQRVEQAGDENRRAAVILDLIIQASDVSHTMQHFTIYKQWNMRLLEEMYSAYASGRTKINPLEGWYEGELWFFDNNIIPLARKLSKCGVFGVSCDEFLDYANDNRLEWELKGREIVQEAADTFKEAHRATVRAEQSYGPQLVAC
jgi:3'5'-cyclic nucleotide phosphodiesterase